MNFIEVRLATPDDLPVLLQFEQGVIAAERPFDSFLKPGTIHYYDLDKLIDSPESIVAVAEQEGEIIGAGYAQIRESEAYWKESKFVYLGFMYVLPAFRGRQVNLQIIEYLRKWAIQEGIHEFRLEVYVQNQAAIRAYEKAGFQPQMLEMRLNTKQDESSAD